MEAAGADYIVICTNTMHKVVPAIQEKITIPILHIAEVTENALKQLNIQKVGLLRTPFTMEEYFYTSIIKKAGIDVVILTFEDRKKISTIIYEE